MSLRITVIAVAATLTLTTACTNKKVNNPLAKVDSKQPDKVLFDRGMDAMKHNRFDIARLDMQTLINTYPDSEFIARAKLSLADSWYAEGGTAALAQAEQALAVISKRSSLFRNYKTRLAAGLVRLFVC